MVRGWAQHPGDRHHGAHGDLVSRSLDVRVGELLDFSQNINPSARRQALRGRRQPSTRIRAATPIWNMGCARPWPAISASVPRW